LMIYPKNGYWNPSSSRVKDFISSDLEGYIYTFKYHD